MILAIPAAPDGVVPSVLALWRDAAEPSHTDDAVSLHRLIARDPEALIVADAHGHIVGSVIAAWDGWRSSIYRLAVCPSHRRRGIGRRLLDTAEARLTRAGASRLPAIVIERDAHAMGFWHASRWQQQVERARFVRG